MSDDFNCSTIFYFYYLTLVFILFELLNKLKVIRDQKLFCFPKIFDD